MMKIKFPKRRKIIVSPEEKQAKFHTLKTLMLADFIEMQSNIKLSLLIAEDGEYTPEQLEKIWADLLTEYYNLIGDGNYLAYLRQSGRIEDKQAKVFCVLNTLGYLYRLHEEYQSTSPILLEELRQLGYPIIFDKENIEKYLNDLSVTRSKIKREEEQIAQWLKEEEPDKKEKSTPDEYFGDLIAVMATVLNVQVDINKTSVWSFCFLYRRLINTNKAKK